MNTNTQVADKPVDPIFKMKAQLEHHAPEFAEFLPSTLSVARFKNFVMAAIAHNPKLLDCDRRTLFNAIRRAALDGLAPDGVEAVLLPYRTKVKDGSGQEKWIDAVQYIPMIAGVRKLALQSREIRDIQPFLIRKNDHYVRKIVNGVTHFEHVPFMGEGDLEPVIGVYSVATFKDGTTSIEVMTRGEVERVFLQSSKQQKKDKDGNFNGEATGGWAKWWDEMAQKTVMKRHCKSLPKSPDIVESRGFDPMSDEEVERRLASRVKLSDFSTNAPKAKDAPAPAAAALEHKPEENVAEAVADDERMPEPVPVDTRFEEEST